MSKYIAKKPDKNGYIHYTSDENETWKILIDRQKQTIQNRACDEFMAGLKKLNLPDDHIPQCPELSETLKACTGWSVVPVAAMISVEEFFKLLANKQFPAASFIRIREELDYLQEPDIFHEFFGHCPLITNQVYADFLQHYGEIALKSDKETYSLLGRLFWFTIEFGLIQTQKGLRIYGGGILSSHQETIYALESSAPQKFKFDIPTILNTPYRYDIIQDKYFIIDQFSDLFQMKLSDVLTLAQHLSNKSNPDENFVTC